MALKTYPRHSLRIVRDRDPILGGTSRYFRSESSSLPVIESAPVMFDGAGSVNLAGVSDLIMGFFMEDGTDKNGAAKPNNSDLEVFVANDASGRILLEANLLSGAPGAQVDHPLAQADMGATVTLRFDPNYLGAGEGGYYFDVLGTGGGIGLTGNGKVQSFINTRVPSDNEESYSVPGDTNAVIRVSLLQAEYYWAA